MLQDVKDYIKIDNNCEDSDILKTIERGKKYLCRKTGTSLNFEEEDTPKQLLLDYCRYSKNNALEYFNDNFASDILFLSLQEGVRTMEVSTDD